MLYSNTYRLGFNASYTGNNYNVTAALTYNFYDSPGSFGGANLAASGNTRGPFYISDALNVDLTATKKFDFFNEGKAKFEIGPVAYGTINLHPGVGPSVLASDRPVLIPGNVVTRQGRFAVGGLIGYDFGIFNAQAFMAHDVVTQYSYLNSVGRRRDLENTEGGFRLTIPLWMPTAAETAPIVRKY